MESSINNQMKSKLSYQSIINELINPMVHIKQLPYKFEVPHMDKFKGREDLREHLRQFKY